MSLKLTALINFYSLLKIPLLAFCWPKVVELSDSKSEVKIALNYRTKNHLRSMYFGALAVGAELSVALMAVDQINKSGMKIDFLFKQFEAHFLKRAEGDVHFVCPEAHLVKQLIEEAQVSEKRLEKTFSGYAYIPSLEQEPIMTYSITLSVRNRSVAKNKS